MHSPSGAGLIRNLFHLGVGQAATTVLTIAFSAAVARRLGAADFGVLYLVTAIAAFTYVLVDWGHAGYVTREIARKPERAGELIGTVNAVRTGMLLLLWAPAVAATWAMGYSRNVLTLTALMTIALLPSTLGLSYSWVFRAAERMEYDATINVVFKASTLVLALVCLALGGRLYGLVLVNAVAGAITLILAVYLYHHLGLPRTQIRYDTAREVIVEGAPMLAIYLAVAVEPYINANLLYRLAPREVVGWFGAAWTIAGTLVAPATILAATMYPRLSKVSGDHREFSRTLRVSFRPLLLVAALGTAGTYLFADFAIATVYSRQKFGPAATILQAFSPVLLLIYIDLLFGNAILAIGKAGQLAAAKVMSVVVTTGTALILIPYCQAHFSNGGIGVVLSMGCGELVMVVGAVMLMRDVITMSMVIDIARAVAANAATVVILRSLPAMSPIVGIPLSIVTFAAVAAAIGLVGRDDLVMLSSMLRKRGAVAPDPSTSPLVPDGEQVEEVEPGGGSAHLRRRPL
jgi:O-antigen/teichoic acid export membrane protein